MEKGKYESMADLAGQDLRNNPVFIDPPTVEMPVFVEIATKMENEISSYRGLANNVWLRLEKLMPFPPDVKEEDDSKKSVVEESVSDKMFGLLDEFAEINRELSVCLEHLMKLV